MISIARANRSLDEKPITAALFSFRYDAELVPGLKENISDAVHYFISLDDRQSEVHFSSEAKRKMALVDKAREINAEWILAVDPDERFEPELTNRISKLTSGSKNIIWSFNLRELYDSDAYRDDGTWGNKKQARLFHISHALEDENAPLHSTWFSQNKDPKIKPSGINLYHLRMIGRHRRENRRYLYASLDPDRLHNPIGYDYLCDERGLRLEKIAPERMYLPPFKETNTIWAAEIDDRQSIVRDPIYSRVNLLARNLQGSQPTALVDLAKDLLPELGEL